MRTLRAARVVSAIRSGSSLPVLVEAEDGSRWLVKLRGAGGGTRALVAEVIYDAFADVVEIDVPRRVVIELEADVPSEARHEEVLDVLRASTGANLGLAFLNGGRPFDPRRDMPSGEIASRVFALDALLMNVDRTSANPNVLVAGGDRFVFIDHGSLLLFEHMPKDQALGDRVVSRHLFTDLAYRFGPEVFRTVIALTDARIDAALDQVPEEWLDGDRARLRALLVERPDRYAEWRDGE